MNNLKLQYIPKKALVVGGSNGIGLAVAKSLIKRGYYVYIADICTPDNSVLRDDSKYEYIFCNLLDFDEDFFRKISVDETINLLMITAGIGRVTDFENIHIKEVEKIININTIAAIKIIHIFYSRIRSKKAFYSGIMGSIAGFVSSPMFSVYAASKAAICRFVESINVELEENGYTNRILNVSPGSILGTRFSGGNNDITKTKNLADKIVENLLVSKTLFIPDYDAIYKDVINKYITNPHDFGISSYEYKKKSGRAANNKGIVIGYLSGTFDLFHVGHLNLLKKAKSECDYLIVGVHPDASHKGKSVFISFEDRKAIVESCKYVDRVVDAEAEDCDAWIRLHYDKLFVGSDYIGTDRFKRYEKYFADKGVKIVYFPYTQSISSTEIRQKILNAKDIV